MSALKIQEAAHENLPALAGQFSRGFGQNGRAGWLQTQIHPLSGCVFKNTNTKTKPQLETGWKRIDKKKKKCWETREPKAGGTEPEHKNGSGDSRSNAGVGAGLS